MDRADRSILHVLSKYGRASIKLLSQESFLSSPAVSARLGRLEKDGIITSYQAHLDPPALGYPILAFVNIAMLAQKRQVFQEFVRNCPYVLECHHVTGNYSMILKVAFPSTKDLDSFVGHLQEFGSTQTQVVFSTVVEPRQIPVLEKTE